MGATIFPAAVRGRSKSPRTRSRFSRDSRGRRSYDGLTGRGAKPTLPDPKAPASWEDDMKELNLEEVLRIAGGVPLSAALDELTYRAPEESASDLVDYARGLGFFLRESEPI
jgi:hypothetical protein